MTTFRSDYEKFGFNESEIIPFLAELGIDINEEESRTNGVAICKPVTFPDWKRVMALLPSLTFSDAAFAFADIDPHDGHYLSDDEASELNRWKEVLLRAVAAMELMHTAVECVSSSGKSEINQGFEPSALLAWCASKGIEYPLPIQKPYPTTDAGLRDALAKCEKERDELIVKSERLEAAIEYSNALEGELAKLKTALQGKDAELKAVAAESQCLKVESLAGKSRTSALKIIGGLVKEAYGMDIHSGRFERIGEVVADLERAGGGITEKTLRGWIKDAAEVIENPKELAILAAKPHRI
jgi:hypothetical protein